jgi:hypothetical protein
VVLTRVFQCAIGRRACQHCTAAAPQGSLQRCSPAAPPAVLTTAVHGPSALDSVNRHRIVPRRPLRLGHMYDVWSAHRRGGRSNGTGQLHRMSGRARSLRWWSCPGVPLPRQRCRWSVRAILCECLPVVDSRVPLVLVQRRPNRGSPAAGLLIRILLFFFPFKGRSQHQPPAVTGDNLSVSLITAN